MCFQGFGPFKSNSLSDYRSICRLAAGSIQSSLRIPGAAEKEAWLWIMAGFRTKVQDGRHRSFQEDGKPGRGG